MEISCKDVQTVALKVKFNLEGKVEKIEKTGESTYKMTLADASGKCTARIHKNARSHEINPGDVITLLDAERWDAEYQGKKYPSASAYDFVFMNPAKEDPPENQPAKQPEIEQSKLAPAKIQNTPTTIDAFVGMRDLLQLCVRSARNIAATELPTATAENVCSLSATLFIQATRMGIYKVEVPKQPDADLPF